MKSKRRNDTSENVLALCRQEGTAWRVLIVRENGARPTVLGAVVGSAEDARDALAQHGVGRVLMAMPSWAYLVRTIRLPKGDDQQLMSALRLEAETRLLGSTPNHRQAMVILGPATSHPVGLVCSWPATLTPTEVPMPSGTSLSVTWAPDIAALAAATGGENEFAATFDPKTGAIALVVPTPLGPMFRSTREPTATGADWSAGVASVFRETLLSEGVDAAETEASVERVSKRIKASEQTLVMPNGADETLIASVDDAEDLLNHDDTGGWLLLLGLLAARRSDLAPLTMFRRDEHVERPRLFTHIQRTLATPRVAAGVVAACVALIVLTPLAATGLRLALVRGKIDDERSLQSSVQRTKNLIEVYRALRSEAWSMTKLLGDIANCMPETLEASGFVLTHGEPVAIEGISKSEGSNDGSEAVLAFAHRLRATGLFENVEPSFSPPDGRGVRNFTITADVKEQARPISMAEEDDYSIVTYSDRRWGKVDEDGYLIDQTAMPAPPAPPEPPVATDDHDDGAETTEPSNTERPSRNESRAVSSSSNDRGAPKQRSQGRGEPAKIPEKVLAEEVDVMNRSEALTRLNEVATAKNGPGLSDELKERLQEDFDLLMQRVRETAP